MPWPFFLLKFDSFALLPLSIHRNTKTKYNHDDIPRSKEPANTPQFLCSLCFDGYDRLSVPATSCCFFSSYDFRSGGKLDSVYYSYENTVDSFIFPLHLLFSSNKCHRIKLRRSGNSRRDSVSPSKRRNSPRGRYFNRIL